MPKIKYVDRKFGATALETIRQANEIIASYEEAGYVLTLRQLYYQFVSRDLITNEEKSYKNLGSVINDARLAGMIDWLAMEDRTRNLKKLADWESPEQIVAAVAEQFRIDKWDRQDYRPEVWIEKDALAGVIERVCSELQVPWFSCRGYTSQSEMWVAGQRILGYLRDDKIPIVLHFGDHDPSGIDMSRDIVDRLEMFVDGYGEVDFERMALNMNQIEEYEPPPNPAKVTDSRAKVYIDKYGHESWELDALRPEVLAELVRGKILAIRDEDAWKNSLEEEDEHKRLLGEVSSNWDKLTRKL